jgi:integrase
MATFFLNDPSRKNSSVKLLVNLHGRKYRVPIRETVPVKFWNQSKKRVKETTGFPEGSLINDRIAKWEAAGLRAYAHFKEYRIPPTEETFIKQVEDEYFKDERDAAPSMLFVEYCDLYINRYSPVRSESTIKKFTTVKNNLTQFQKDRKKKLYFEDIDINFYNDFQRWFYGQDHCDNYFGSQIKIIKQIYAEARDTDHLHNLTGTSHKDFVTVTVEADAIFLTVEELMQLHRLQLTSEMIRTEWPDMTDLNVSKKITSLEMARARFLIGAFSGLRVSDFNRLNRDNVTDYIRILSQKTKFNTVIPVHPVIREILAGGFDLDSSLSDQRVNRRIKEIAKFAGLTQERPFYERRGGKVITGTFPQYELITTHTARRSFATNAYISGVPLYAIKTALGHKKIETTIRYLRLTAQQNAEKLAKHPFFADGLSAEPTAEPFDSDEIEETVGI